MNIWTTIARQFGMPEGFLGRIAGYIMSNRSSNRERIEWAIYKLNVHTDDSILEIGFGPGIAINIMSKMIDVGHIVGLDHSSVMFKQAGKRNHESITSGKVRLYCDSIQNIKNYNFKFDKILDINSFQFWDNRPAILNTLRYSLNNNGLIAIVHQPRKPGSTDRDAEEAGEKIAEDLRIAGYKNVTSCIKIMKPVSTVCVTGYKQD